MCFVMFSNPPPPFHLSRLSPLDSDVQSSLAFGWLPGFTTYLMEADAILVFVSTGQLAGILGRVASGLWPTRWSTKGLVAVQLTTFVAIIAVGLSPGGQGSIWSQVVMSTLHAVRSRIRSCNLKSHHLLFCHRRPKLSTSTRNRCLSGESVCVWTVADSGDDEGYACPRCCGQASA